MKKTNIIFILIIVLTIFSCKKNTLEIENLNNPSLKNIFDKPESVYNVASGLYYKWYMTQTSSISPQMSMFTMADQGSSSWANSGMLDLSSEPREAFNNQESYKYASTFERYYADMYATLWQANDILDIIREKSMEIGELDKDGKGEDTEMVKAMCYYVQGLSLGYIGLVYDKAYISVDNMNNIVNQPLSPYKDVVDAAIKSMDKCIEICQSNNFTIPDDWINGSEYSNQDLARLANSYVARFRVYSPRNAFENTQVNWSDVITRVSSGINNDFEVYMDNVNWKNYFFKYTVAQDNWVRIDARIINLMDHNYPYKYPSNGQNPGPASSNDARLASDFHYNSVCGFKPERGYYHFSNYEYNKRYAYSPSNPANVTEFSVTELDLFRAEALYYTSNKNGAIDVINFGTRVNRGGLDALPYSITDEQFIDSLYYERDIELIMTGFGISFFDMRRRDKLQKGTMLHFPIPAKELGVMKMSNYTFGGTTSADGINTSNGGWFPSK